MPTIKQLPVATVIAGSDLLPISQNGQTRSATVSALLGNTQPLLAQAQNTLVGRSSSGTGPVEAVNVGTGLSVQSGTVVANATDHVGLTLSTSLLSDDEVIVNSGASPRRLPATKLRSLFTAGFGVQIDSSGVISWTGSSSGSGSVGPKGDTGATGPAGQGFTFRGAWQASITYYAYDVVTSGGQTYVATTTVPGATSFSSAAWTLVAAQGATGPAGATGPVGLTGPAGPTLAATASAIGAVKPGVGLSVASDGTLSISNVSLSALAQGSASVGQLLGWTGTGWAPTTTSTGANYSGASPITVSSGIIALSQSGASSGQVLAWNGTAWVPQNPASSGATVGSALPLVNGAASAGVSLNASREDHRHPTDTTRAPTVAPVFSGSLTLPTWTTSTRPSSPSVGMEGFATDISRLETYTSAGWVQFVRTTDIPAANGQLLGGTTVAGTSSAVSIGSGLSLTAGTLSVTTSAPTSVSGISVDGSSIVASTSAPYQMSAADRVVDVNKTNGAATRILLPTSPMLWSDYTIIDGRGDAGSNNITITGAAGTLINGGSSFVMTANNDAISLRAVNATTWRVV